MTAPTVTTAHALETTLTEVHGSETSSLRVACSGIALAAG